MRKLRATDGTAAVLVVLAALVVTAPAGAAGAAGPVGDLNRVESVGTTNQGESVGTTNQGESVGTTNQGVSARSVTSPAFASSALTDQRGDVVPFAVLLSEGSSARVTVVGQTNNYRAELILSDDSFDGRVTVEFNTFTLGSNGTFTVQNPSDEVTVRSRKGPTGVVPPGNYRLLIDDGNERAELTIESRETKSINTMVAPVNASARLKGVDDVARYREAGNLTLRSSDGPAEVATRDTLVVRLRASGLAGAMAAQPGETVTERFRALVDSDLVSLSVEQVDPAPDVAPARLDLDGPGVHVVYKRDSDAYYLVVDTATAQVTRGDETGTGLPVGARFRTNLTVTAASDLASSPETVTGSFLVVERSATVGTHSEAGALWVLPEQGQRVAGNTTLAPGSTVRVHVRTSDGAFERTTTATVQPGDGRGSFETTVGLQSLSEGTTVQTSVLDATGELTSTPESVTVRTPSATLDSSTLTVEGATLQVTLSANLSRGGLVTVRADNASGRLVGVVPVDPGGERVSVPLSDPPAKNTPLVVRAVRDLDGDGVFTPGVDEPYEEANSPRPIELTMVLYRTPPSATKTPSSTPTATVTATAGTTPTGSPTATETTRTRTATDDGGLASTVPGFGPLVALLAVLVAIARLRRRG